MTQLNHKMVRVCDLKEGDWLDVSDLVSKKICPRGKACFHRRDFQMHPGVGYWTIDCFNIPTSIVVPGSFTEVKVLVDYIDDHESKALEYKICKKTAVTSVIRTTEPDEIEIQELISRIELFLEDNNLINGIFFSRGDAFCLQGKRDKTYLEIEEDIVEYESTHKEHQITDKELRTAMERIRRNPIIEDVPEDVVCKVLKAWLA